MTRWISCERAKEERGDVQGQNAIANNVQYHSLSERFWSPWCAWPLRRLYALCSKDSRRTFACRISWWNFIVEQGNGFLQVGVTTFAKAMARRRSVEYGRQMPTHVTTNISLMLFFRVSFVQEENTDDDSAHQDDHANEIRKEKRIAIEDCAAQKDGWKAVTWLRQRTSQSRTDDGSAKLAKTSTTTAQLTQGTIQMASTNTLALFLLASTHSRRKTHVGAP